MTRLGVIVPSSNTVLEPVMAGVLASNPVTTMHVARLRVTRISADRAADSQFDILGFLGAARLLADANVDLILWSGTAASWLGFARDEDLAAAILRDVSIPATTAVLAINAALARLGAARIGLVTPYGSDIEARIVANFAAAHIDVVATARSGLTDNAAFAQVPQVQIEAMIRDVGRSAPDAVVVMCTNLNAAPLVGRLSAELGLPIIDSVLESTNFALALLRSRHQP